MYAKFESSVLNVNGFRKVYFFVFLPNFLKIAFG